MSDLVQIQSRQDRLDRLQELTQFTERCNQRLDDMFKALGWSRDEGCNQEPLEQCPHDPNHRVPARSMEKHQTSCCLRRMGYSAEEQAEMVDPPVCSENGGGFVMGQYSGQPVDVPQNHKRAVCDLTVADRLALYDHVVGVLRQQKEAASSNDDLYLDLMSKLQKGDEHTEPKTHLELMAEMRDYKRRRQSYRAKNVHITKKSYTEVIREVISVHSEELSRQWREEEEEGSSSHRYSKHSELMRTSEDTKQREERLRSESSESHRSRDRSRDGGSKKKKRKRERDSRSPEDHRRNRKKKKKKDQKDK